MLLLFLVFYFKYETPPDEQNFPMVMEMLWAADVREDDDSLHYRILSNFFHDFLLTFNRSSTSIIFPVMHSITGK